MITSSHDDPNDDDRKIVLTNAEHLMKVVIELRTLQSAESRNRHMAARRKSKKAAAGDAAPKKKGRRRKAKKAGGKKKARRRKK